MHDEKETSHRDIKLDNILLKKKEGIIKLTDFGFSAPIQGRDGTGLHKTQLGSPIYMAPEIIAGQPYTGQGADLFATGVVLFMLLTGMTPF